MNFTTTNTYRIGQPGLDIWVGANYGRQYVTFEAPDMAAAWKLGQEMIARAWGPNVDVIVALERLVYAPKVLLIGGRSVHSILDTMPQGFPLWARVVVGIAGAEFPAGL